MRLLKLFDSERRKLETNFAGHRAVHVVSEHFAFYSNFQGRKQNCSTKAELELKFSHFNGFCGIEIRINKTIKRAEREHCYSVLFRSMVVKEKFDFRGNCQSCRYL